MFAQKPSPQKIKLIPPPAWPTDLCTTLPPLLSAMCDTLKDAHKSLLEHIALIMSNAPILCLRQTADSYLTRQYHPLINASLDHLKKQQKISKEKIEQLYGLTPNAHMNEIQRRLEAGISLYKNNEIVLFPEILDLADKSKSITTLLVRHYGIYFSNKTIDLKINTWQLYQEYLKTHHASYSKSLKNAMHPFVFFKKPATTIAAFMLGGIVPPRLFFSALAIIIFALIIVNCAIPDAHSAAFEKIARTMQEKVQMKRRYERTPGY